MRVSTATFSILCAVLLLASVEASVLTDNEETGVTANSSRTDVSFNYGWRFHLGDSPDAQACEFTGRNLSGLNCTGSIFTDMGREDPVGCKLACCYFEGCYKWTWGKWWTKDGKGGGCYLTFDKNAQCVETKDSGLFTHGSERDDAPPCQTSYKYSDPATNDSSWELVDAPHDGMIRDPYAASNDETRGYFNRNVTWYRKHFAMPAEWDDGSPIWLRFDGVEHVAQVWLNGYYMGRYGSGYVPIVVPLAGAAADAVRPGLVNFGAGARNVIAVRADATFGSEHWYSGAGIYRDVHLIRAAGPFSFDAIGPGAVFADTNIDVTTGKAVSFQVKADVNNNATSLLQLDHRGPQTTGAAELADGTTVVVVHELFDFDKTMKVPAGATPIASASTAATAIPTGQQQTIALPGAGMSIPAGSVRPWSVQNPKLYLLRSTARVGSSTGAACDEIVQTVGFRSLSWPQSGLKLNGETIQTRGFSNHNDFGGVGTAMPARLHLYQMYALRSTGAQFRRQSHNPADPVQLDVLDRLGVLTWDEQRDYDIKFIADWVAMVRRDRSHASVVVWSTCNEVECFESGNATDIAAQYRSSLLSWDASRPLSANMDPASTEALWPYLDVQGFSHQGANTFTNYHQYYPTKAVVASECCSCLTQRGENTKNDSSGAFFPSFDGDCLPRTLLKSYELDYVSGSLGVWTATDYYGEDGGWPHISSSFGQFDLAGFPKPQAEWWRAWWLYNISRSDPGRSPVGIPAGRLYGLQIVEEWAPDAWGNTPEQIHVYTSAPSVQLRVLPSENNADPIPLGTATVSKYGYATFNISKFVPGRLEAIANDPSGQVTGDSTARCTPGKPASLHVSLDAPAITTGTGFAVYADGSDVALVRAVLVDGQGCKCSMASHNATFEVLQGPAAVWGVANGDPSSHEPNAASWRSLYHGMSRAVVRVMLDARPASQAWANQIDLERTPGGVHVGAVPPAGQEVVIRASVPELGLSQDVTVQLSDNEMDGPLASAVGAEPFVDSFQDNSIL